MPEVISQLPPVTVPLMDKSGQMTPAWRRFLETLWKRTGGFKDEIWLAQFAALFTSTSFSSLQATIDQQANVIAELRAIILAHRSYDDQINELRGQIAATERQNSTILQQQQVLQQDAEKQQNAVARASLVGSQTLINKQWASIQAIADTDETVANLTTTNIPEGTRLYYTDARARAAISATGTGISYNNTTGVLTLSLGTAAQEATGTSGHVLPFLDGSNTFGGTQTMNNLTVTGTLTATITGNAATATKLVTARTIAITGDLSWTSPSFDGSGNVTAAGTLATVNSNVGSFGGASSVPNFTVNAKGLITAAGSTTVVAPAGTLTGTTLAANVTASSLTSLGTLTSLTVGGTTNINNGTATGASLTLGTGGNALIAAAAGALTWNGGGYTVTMSGPHLFSSPPKIPASTVAALPPAATYPNGLSMVTDATAPAIGAVVVGGGAVRCQVASDGTNWRVA